MEERYYTIRIKMITGNYRCDFKLLFVNKVAEDDLRYALHTIHSFEKLTGNKCICEIHDYEEEE